LIREDRAGATAEGVVSAARALRNIIVHLPPTVAAAALIDEFHADPTLAGQLTKLLAADLGPIAQPVSS
jgi:hypothetical protein